MRLQDIEAPDLILDASLEMCRCEDFYFDETLQLAGSIRIEKDSDSAG